MKGKEISKNILIQNSNFKIELDSYHLKIRKIKQSKSIIELGNSRTAIPTTESLKLKP